MTPAQERRYAYKIADLPTSRGRPLTPGPLPRRGGGEGVGRLFRKRFRRRLANEIAPASSALPEKTQGRDEAAVDGGAGVAQATAAAELQTEGPEREPRAAGQRRGGPDGAGERQRGV